jgi:hypothetical protein
MKWESASVEVRLIRQPLLVFPREIEAGGAGAVEAFGWAQNKTGSLREASGGGQQRNLSGGDIAA